MASNWYAVKTFYRSTSEGRPEKPDRFYDPDLTLVEERTLLIKAKTRAEAIKKAEREARDYAKVTEYTNPYDQKVTTKYTGLFDIDEIEGNINDKSEIFVKSRVVSKKVSDSKISHVYIGKRDNRLTESTRKKFLNRDYLNGEAM